MAARMPFRFRRWKILVASILAAAGLPAAAQAPAPIPDFTGLWHRWLRPGLGPPSSGPGPVTNRSRLNGVSNYNQLVGDLPRYQTTLGQKIHGLRDTLGPSGILKGASDV